MQPQPPIGGLDILNVNAGHLKFNFNKDDAIETERARKCINDMMKRGYSIFIEVEGHHERVKKFDQATDTYFIDGAPSPTDPEPIEEIPDTPSETEKRPRGRPTKLRGIPARSTRATAIAPTSGG